MGQAMGQTSPHLLRARRSKDRAGYTGSQQAFANEAREARFMAGAASADDGDVRGRLDGGRVAVDDLVGNIGEDRGIGQGQGVEGVMDGFYGVGQVVLRCCSYFRRSSLTRYWGFAHTRHDR